MSEYIKPDEFIQGSWQQESCKAGRLFPRTPGISNEILHQMNQKIDESRRGKTVNVLHTNGRTARIEGYGTPQEEMA